MADQALNVQTDSGKAERVCAFCFDVFAAVKPWQRFCCALCQEEHLAGSRRVKSFDPRRAVVNCKGCGVSFAPINIKALFCGDDCKHQHFSRLRNETGQGARITKAYRDRHPEKIALAAREYAKRRYEEIKANPYMYEKWRDEMSGYHCPGKRREAQRRRNAQSALATLLLPTPKNLKVNQ